MDGIRISPFGASMWKTIGWHMLIRDDDVELVHLKKILASMYYRIQRLESEVLLPFGVANMSNAVGGMMNVYEAMFKKALNRD